jgi:hypothetical protein
MMTRQSGIQMGSINGTFTATPNYTLGDCTYTVTCAECTSIIVQHTTPAGQHFIIPPDFLEMAMIMHETACSKGEWLRGIQFGYTVEWEEGDAAA